MLKRQNNQKEAGIGAFKKQKFVFSKLINFAVPDTIDPRVINLGSKLSLFKKLENLTLAINSAQVSKIMTDVRRYAAVKRLEIINGPILS